MQRKQIKKNKKETSSPVKKNIGVLVDYEVWKRFRIHCFDKEKRPGDLLTKVIDNYLGEIMA